MNLTVNKLIDKFGELQLISSPEDVKDLKTYFGNLSILDRYDSFFIDKEGENYTLVFGMVGTVPYLTKHVYDVLEMVEPSIYLVKPQKDVSGEYGAPIQYNFSDEASAALSDIPDSKEYCVVYVSLSTAKDHGLPGAGWYIRMKSSVDYYVPILEQALELGQLPSGYEPIFKRSDIEIYQHSMTKEMLIRITRPKPFHKLTVAEIFNLEEFFK